MTKTKKYMIAVVSSLVIGLMVVSVRIANEAKRIGAYSNPDATASRLAVRQNPNNAAAHMSLAHYYNIAGSRYDSQAVQELQEVVRIEPQNREAKFMLAYKLSKINQKAKALQLYQELAQQQDNWGKAALKHLRNTSTGPSIA